MLDEKSGAKKQMNAAKYKSKLGLLMFLIYTLVYAGFILITVIRPDLMGLDIGYLNLAIVYGFGLIVFALILAIIYNIICARCEKKWHEDDQTVLEGEK